MIPHFVCDFQVQAIIVCDFLKSQILLKLNPYVGLVHPWRTCLHEHGKMLF